MMYVERDKGVVRLVFGFSLLPWSDWDETVAGLRIRTRELYVFFGPWTWRTEWIRQLEDGEEI